MAEGDEGFSADYAIYLRPCTSDMKANTRLDLIQSVPGQVELSTDSIFKEAWNPDCKVTVTVTAAVDEKEEGDHFVTLGHVASSQGGDDIVLSDMSVLYASNVLVRIYDDELAGVVIDESLGYTATAEVDRTKASLVAASLYDDSYKIRLSKKPTSNVTVRVNTVATATDRLTPSTMSLIGRDYTERNQLKIQGETGDPSEEYIVLVFTNETWSTWQTVYVYAIDDLQQEGTDLLYFPSQPSFLSFIQGPIKVIGQGSADIPQIAAPLMLPYEFDDTTFSPNFTLPSNGSLYVIEEQQVDSLVIHNTDVRGNEPSIGIVSLGWNCFLLAR